MPSNFTFLKAGWSDLYPEAMKAERNAAADPRTSCFYARRTLELAVRWMYDADESLRTPVQERPVWMLFEPSFHQLVERRIRTKMDVIRRQGNAAVHDHARLSERGGGRRSARAVPRAVLGRADLRARTGGRAAGRVLRSIDAAIPHPRASRSAADAGGAAQADRGEQASGTRSLQRRAIDNAKLQARARAVAAQIAQAKAANEARPDEHDYDEQETRDRYIDLLLTRRVAARSRSAIASSRSHGMPNSQRRRAMSTTCCGETTASRWLWSRRSGRGATRRAAASRPSCMPTAWSRSSGSGR